MEIYRIARGEPIKLSFKGHSEVAQFLNQLHDYYELSWPQIAKLASLNPPGSQPIPVSTLARIAETGIVPKKWRFRFPGVKAIDGRQRIAISKRNPSSAKETIINNLDKESAMILTILLMEHFKDELPWR